MAMLVSHWKMSHLHRGTRSTTETSLGEVALTSLAKKNCQKPTHTGACGKRPLGRASPASAAPCLDHPNPLISGIKFSWYTHSFFWLLFGHNFCVNLQKEP